MRTFIKETKNAIQSQTNGEEAVIIKNIIETYGKDNNIECRLNDYNVFSIDPVGSQDFDDAFSIKEFTDYTLISIYIANVPVMIDYLDLWTYFTNLVSTIYLPNEKKNMLSPLLADNLCSLQEGKERIAFTMDIKFNINSNKIKFIDIVFTNSIIKLTKNYIYEEPELLKNKDYLKLFEITKHLQSINPYMELLQDSHDIIAYYMIMMNYECSKLIVEKNVGILRATRENKMKNKQNQIKTEKENEKIPNEIKNFVKGWQSETSGYYCDVKDNSVNKSHTLIGAGLETYTHITSPIRRIN